jgi:hypothetical protein
VLRLSGGPLLNSVLNLTGVGPIEVPTLCTAIAQILRGGIASISIRVLKVTTASILKALLSGRAVLI